MIAIFFFLCAFSLFMIVTANYGLLSFVVLITIGIMSYMTLASTGSDTAKILAVLFLFMFLILAALMILIRFGLIEAWSDWWEVF